MGLETRTMGITQATYKKGFKHLLPNIQLVATVQARD